MKLIALDDVMDVIKKHFTDYEYCFECGQRESSPAHLPAGQCTSPTCKLPSNHHEYNPHINIVLLDLMVKARDE